MSVNFSLGNYTHIVQEHTNLESLKDRAVRHSQHTGSQTMTATPQVTNMASRDGHMCHVVRLDLFDHPDKMSKAERKEFKEGTHNMQDLINSALERSVNQSIVLEQPKQMMGFSYTDGVRAGVGAGGGVPVFKSNVRQLDELQLKQQIYQSAEVKAAFKDSFGVEYKDRDVIPKMVEGRPTFNLPWKSDDAITTVQVIHFASAVNDYLTSRRS